MKKLSERGLKEGKISLEALIALKLAKHDFVSAITIPQMMALQW